MLNIFYLMICAIRAGVAQLIERFLAKEEATSLSLVTRTNLTQTFFCQTKFKHPRPTWSLFVILQQEERKNYVHTDN